MDLGVLGLVLAGLSLVWQVGAYVSKKTKNTVDDAVFQHPEIEAAVKEIVQKLLAKKA